MVKIVVMRYPESEFIQSPNFRRGRKDNVSKIVLHVTDGQAKLQRAVEHLCKPENQVSAHFIIGQDGSVIQLVDTDNTAWHASGANNYSIGIEHVARSKGELSSDDEGLDFTEEQYLSSVRLVKWLLEQYNLTSKDILGHSELTDENGKYLSTHRDCPYKCIDKAKYFSLLNYDKNTDMVQGIR